MMINEMESLAEANFGNLKEIGVDFEHDPIQGQSFKFLAKI